MTISHSIPDRAIMVHGLHDALAALKAADALDCPVVLLGTAYGGVLWFRSIVEQAQATYPAVCVTALFDCGDNPGLVLGALRSGLEDVVFTGKSPARMALNDVAALYGATLWPERPTTCLNLRGTRDPVEACRMWLMA